MNSGVSKIDSFLKRHTKVGFDSNVLIAIVEANPDYGQKARTIFSLFEHYENEVWTSVITLPEVLIKPLRSKRFDLAQIYETRLSKTPISFAEIKFPTARQATTLGAMYNLEAKDALILASLIGSGVTGFITADKDFEKIQEVEVLLIS